MIWIMPHVMYFKDKMQLLMKKLLEAVTGGPMHATFFFILLSFLTMNQTVNSQVYYRLTVLLDFLILLTRERYCFYSVSS